MLAFLNFGFAQSTIRYEDNLGNEIIIYNADKLPPEINLEFLKRNISGVDFGLDSKQHNYEIAISDIQKKSKKKYILKVIKTPKSDNIQETLRYLGGGQFYSLKLFRKQGVTQNVRIKYLYSVT